MTNKQTILIAGATGNIGRAAAEALAKRGAGVVLLGRSPDKLNAKAELVSAALSEVRIDHQDIDIDILAIDGVGGRRLGYLSCRRPL
jgi:short-subunit dehydrogenase